MVEYFHLSLNKRVIPTSEFGSIDLSAIAKDSSAPDIVRIVMMVVGAAIQCEERAQYIGYIMELNSESQVVLKDVIERVMQCLEPVDGGSSSPTNNRDDDFRRRLSSGDLNEEVEINFDDAPNEALKEKVEKLESREEESRKEIVELQNKLVAAQQEVADLSASSNQMSMVENLVDDLHKRLEESESELTTMRHQLTSAMSENAEFKSKYRKAESDLRLAKDENEILGQKAEELGRAEVTIGKYKKKLEEAATIKAHISTVEEQCSKYLDQIMDLEAKLKSTSTLQKKVEEAKVQSSGLGKKVFELESKLQILDAENVKIKGELTSANSAKKMFKDELDKIKSSVNTDAKDDEIADVDLSFDQGIPLLRERLARLERENKTLREAQAQPRPNEMSMKQKSIAPPAPPQNDKVDELLSKARTELTKKEQEVHALIEKVAVLDSQIEQLTKKSADHESNVASLEKQITAKTTENADLEKKSADQELELANAQSLVLSLQQQIKEKETKISELVKEVTVKEKEITSKTADIQSLTDKTNDKIHSLEHELKVVNERSTLSEDINNEQKSTILTLTTSIEDLNAVIKEKTEKIDEISNNLLISEKNKLRLTGEKAAGEAQITKLSSQNATQKSQIEKLTSEKAKLELYAKQSLHKFQNKFLVALQNLKQKLKEKQEKIDRLEGEKVVQKREERLICGSMYELGLEILRGNVEKMNTKKK